MKFNDNITLDIASAVSDVLEGKKGKHIAKKVNKEEMDPTDHVKKSDEGKFCVYNAANKKVKEFDTKDEADKYAIDNHDKLMAAKNEVAQPKPKGEKEFHDLHDIEVSGEAPDGKVTKAKKGNYYKESIEEEMAIMNYMFNSQKELTKFMQMVKPVKDVEVQGQEKLPGGKRTITVHASRQGLTKLHKIFTKLQGDEVAEEATPTGPAKEESEKQKKYQAFFTKALKKFGVKSPSELEGDKKKEFFDYVDANYEADNEPKESVQVNEEVPPAFVKKYSSMRMGIAQIEKNIDKEDEKHPFDKDDDKIEAMKDKIKKIRDAMKKMVDKFGSGVTKGDDFQRGGY